MERKTIALSLATGIALARYDGESATHYSVETRDTVIYASFNKDRAVHEFCKAIDYALGFIGDKEAIE